MKEWRPVSRDLGIAVVLAALTVLTYSRVFGLQFVRYDDHRYITENPSVLGGLSAESVRWAFSSFHASNWHPLTWLSHLLDVELFGADPAWHHAVNLLFHVLNSVLLFVVLRHMTGEPWKSAFVAALFAVHPLHVESVAWISERKDVLSTFFWILTMWAYYGYAIRMSAGRYLAVLALFTLGLLAKPMLVTLPFVLLLLDHWPLGRLGYPQRDADEAGRRVPVPGRVRIVLEKVPLLVLSAASCVVTYVAQSHTRTVASTSFPLWARVSNSLDSYARYIGKTFYPAGLAIFYPHPINALPGWEVAGAAILLAALGVTAWRLRFRMPYLSTGWFWFLGTLVPVIGIVQVGEQAMADRYSYVPLIGIFIALTWGAVDMARRFRVPGRVLGAAGGAALLCLAAVAWNQTGYWRDSITLFRHAVEVTKNNSKISHALGIAYAMRGHDLLLRRRTAEAVEDLAAANRYKPVDPVILSDLGLALANEGRLEEASKCLRTVVDIKPDWEQAHFTLGLIHDLRGERVLAEEQFRETLRINPSNRDARARLSSDAERSQGATRRGDR